MTYRSVKKSQECICHQFKLGQSDLRRHWHCATLLVKKQHWAEIPNARFSTNII